MEIEPQEGKEKEAGGDILARLAQLISRPFVGAAKGQAINKAVQAGITKGINEPLEAVMRKARLHRAIGKFYEIGMTPIPGTPKLFHPILPDPAQRRAYGAWKGDDIVHTLSQHPEAAVVGGLGTVVAPAVPGITEGYLAGKHLLGKAIKGKTKLADRMSGFSDEIEKIAWRDHLPGGLADKKKPSQFNSRQLKKGKKVELEHVNSKELATEIAMDHLVEDGHYYDKLEKMEKQAAVSPYQQETQWTCSAACLKAVLGHYGVDVPEELVVQAVGAREGRGAECDEIAEAARRFGFDSFQFSFDSLEQAKFLLDQDIPIICDIQSFNHPGKGHYVVLVSVDEAGVHLMDPNTPGNQRTISHEEMESRWWDRSIAPPHLPMIRWGIVVLPPEEPHE
jgi:predicted double-glycine peptidase